MGSIQTVEWGRAFPSAHGVPGKNRSGETQRPPWVPVFWALGVYTGITALRTIYSINHIDHWSLFTCYLAVWIAGLLACNGDVCSLLRQSLDRKSIYLLAVFLGSIAIFYRTQSVDQALLAGYENVHFAYTSLQYLVSKSADILLQQIMFTAFVLSMTAWGYSLQRIQVFAAILLGLLHLYTLYSLPIIIGAVFILAATASGICWPFLLLRCRRGLLFNYMSHWFFYVVMGIFFNLLVTF